jgi:hypothetical protein
VTDAQQKLYNATLSPDSDISRLGYQIDAVKNNERNGDKDLRDSIEEVVDKASDKLRGLTKDIYKIQVRTLLAVVVVACTHEVAVLSVLMLNSGCMHS